MINSNKLFQKGFSIFTGLSLIFQSFLPGISVLAVPAYAQEVVEEAPAPADEPILTPEPTVTVEPTVEPTAEPEASPTDVPVVIESEPTSEPSPTIIVEPTAEAESESSEETQLMAVVLPDTSAESVESLDLNAQTVDSSSASLITDKADYAPTDTALISGTGLTASATYTLVISSTDEPAVNFSTQVTADENGSFVYAYQLDGIYRPNYTVELKDNDGNIVASTSFTDTPPPSVDFKQCANENPTAGACDWIGSILQANNSVYFEGMSVPQRLLYRGIGNGAHAISFKYSYTKGGIHAYDFITGKNQGNGSFSPGITTFNNCGGLSGPDLTACNALVILTENFVSIPNDSFDSKDSAPGAGTGTTQTAKETFYGARSISVYNTGTISSTSISPITHDVAADGDTGDSDAQVTFNFTLASCGSGCNVMLYFDGHLAVGGSDNTTGVNWGPALGSANINGGPYHIKNVQLDGSGGSLDNQIQGSSILVPNDASIIIHKDTVPDAAQDFGYTTTGGLTPSTFNLDDDADGTLPNTQTYISLAPGAYSVTEGIVAGYSLTGLVCTDLTGNTTVSLGTRTATIDLAASETVDCTYTNTLQTGHIVVDKVTDPVGDPQSFSFVTTGSGYAGFSLTDAAAPNDQTLNAGAYTVSETVPAGWDLTNTNCVSSIGDTETAGSLELDAGETITCTFTNQADAFIIVDKVTDPSGDPTLFDFTTSYGSPFTLADATTPNNSGDLAPGTYSVTEAAEAGWDPTGATCSDGSPVGAIVLSAGEVVTCTFNNQKDAFIIVEKQTDPNGDPTLFDFDTDYDSGDFDLADGGSNTSSDLDPGTYSVAENVPSGWDLTSAICSDGSLIGAISLQAGETVTCTFTNTKRGHIIIVKDAIPNDTQDFNFNNNFGNGNPAAFLLDNDGNNGNTLSDTRDSEVLPGTYAVSEDGVAGWDSPESTSCTDGSPVNAIVVSPGETVTCTFVNEKLATIILVKNTIGGNDTFDFVMTGSGLPSGTQLTTIGNTANTTFSNLDPDNTYSITETPIPAGWDLISSSCTGTNTPASITPNAGEVITCTFTNEEDAFIIVEKQTDPDGDPTIFDFDLSYGDLDADLSDGQTDNSGDLDPGIYSVAENVPAGWDLTSAICSDGSTIGAISLQAGETVTCVFTNQKDAFIIIEKQTDPNGDPQVFDFDLSYGSGDADLSDGQTDNSGDLDPGIYSVVENLPAGWDFEGAVCSDGSNPSAISLQAGETVTCVFTNEKDANIVVVKQTDPDGDPTSFEFDPSYAANFFLSDGQSNDSGDLDPNAYSVAEILPAGWDLESSVCVSSNLDPETPASISLQAGETVTCTFTDEKDAFIIVEKQTDPNGDPTIFDFDLSYGDGDADLSDGQTDNSGDIDPGTYSVAENVPAGWDLTSAICSDGSPIGDISLQAGETVTCVFTNQADAFIIVEKETDPNGDPTLFDFDTDYDSGDIDLADGQSDTSSDLVPGTYSVAENVPAGWDLTSATCTDGTPASISLQAGETVTCTFTNTKQGKITIAKDAQPNDCQDFAFTFTGKPNFSLDNDSGVADCTDTNRAQSTTFSNLPVNVAYTAAETLPNAFWEFGGVSCVYTGGITPYTNVSNVTNGVTVTLDPGADVTCTFVNNKLGPTRTLGFWQTHVTYTTSVFNAPANTFLWFAANNMIVGSGTVGGSQDPIDTIGKLLGGFWSDIAKKTNKQQRNATDKARMQLAQQLLAAELNCGAFGCPASIQSLIATANGHYTTGTPAQMLVDAALLDAYNNSGDTITIGSAGKADPKAAKAAANYGFWDTP